MTNRFKVATAALAALALALTACGADNGGNGGGGGATPDGGSGGEGPAGTLTMAGWSLDSTPEFSALVDGFNATNPDYEVELVQYDAAEYETQMAADLAAGNAPDIYPQKSIWALFTFIDGQQTLDVSDVAAELTDNESVQFYEANGATHAVPYRQDAWFLFYNKDLFAEAGVEEPDGTWTWDDYVVAAKDLTAGLDGVKGTHQHSWQSTAQGFANAQVGDEGFLSGDFEYFTPYYERSLELQEAGAQETFGTVTTNQLTYQAQFGTQKTAMMLMGSWYIATLIAQQDGGEAEDFEWGIAPAPQIDSSTTGPDSSPVTFGAPTGLSINPAIDEDKLETAKAFANYVASEEGALALVSIGITPAVLTDAVIEKFFETEGMPTDDLSKFTFSNRTIGLETPASEHTAALNNILNDAHSAILSGSESIEDALRTAEERAANEVLNQ